MGKGKVKHCSCPGCRTVVDWETFCRTHYGQIPGEIRSAMGQALAARDTLGFNKAVGNAIRWFVAKQARTPLERPKALMANLFGGGDA